jgi:hypothetical protein
MNNESFEFTDTIEGGVLLCIKGLRELQDQYRHQSKWNFSNDSKFAPVELSDWLLVNVLRKLNPNRGLK